MRIPTVDLPSESAGSYRGPFAFRRRVPSSLTKRASDKKGGAQQAPSVSKWDGSTNLQQQQPHSPSRRANSAKKVEAAQETEDRLPRAVICGYPPRAGQTRKSGLTTSNLSTHSEKMGREHTRPERKMHKLMTSEEKEGDSNVSRDEKGGYGSIFSFFRKK